MFAARVEPAGNGLRFGIPQVLFQVQYRALAHVVPSLSWAVSADGQRFFVQQPPIVRLVAAEARKPQRRFGAMRGRARVTSAFLEPLDQEELNAWEG